MKLLINMGSFPVITLVLLGCSGVEQPGGSLCQEAAKHISTCLDRTIQQRDTCDLVSAEQILGLDCTQILMAAETKADFVEEWLWTWAESEDGTSVFLLGGDAGELAMVQMDTWNVEPIEGTFSGRVSSVRYSAGFFFILLEVPQSEIVVIDVGTAMVVRTIPLELEEPRDLAILDEAFAYISSVGSSELLKLDLETGQITSRIDLSSYAPETGSVHAEKMTVLEQGLFVQLRRQDQTGYLPGALVVIDPFTDEVLGVIELEVPRPDFSMILDTFRNRLLVAVKGGSYGMNGGIRAVDLDNLSLTDFLLPAYSGEQGAFLLAHGGERLYVIYHTEVPFVSTHLLAFQLDEDGSVSEDQPFNQALYDTWDGHDSLATDSLGQFIAIPDACLNGLCRGSIGLHVFDSSTNQEVHTLGKEVLGFAPVWIAPSNSVSDSTPGE